MKRIFMILAVLAGVSGARAQLPIQNCGDAGYLYSPNCTDGDIDYRIWYPDIWPISGGFVGAGFHAYRDTVVYGVSVPDINLGDFPYLWVYLLKPRFHSKVYEEALHDSVPLYTMEKSREELFCFITNPPEAHSMMRFVSRGSDTNVLTVPMCDFYFREPCPIDSGEFYFVGIGHSIFNQYNHMLKDNPNPDGYLPWAILYLVLGIGDHSYSPDSTALLVIRYYPPERFPTQYSSEPRGINAIGADFGFLAIVHPPEGVEANPRHEEPIGPAAVMGLRIDSVAEGHAVMTWDSAAPSEWGPVGVRVDKYQLNYAEYSQDYAEGGTVESVTNRVTIGEVLDTTKFYKARCRARSDHVCDIHDTVMWGPWSEEAYFYTGTTYPDTAPLGCVPVEGFRQAGMRGGMPYFEWDRSAGHTEYEVEYVRERGTAMYEVARHRHWTMPRSVEPGREYRVRVRAKCIHQCYIHDTMMWSAWSEALRVTAPGEATGIAEEREGGGMLSIEPNPASGSVTVRVNAEAGKLPGMLTMTDMQGREVLRREVRDGSAQRVDVRALPSGTYMVTLSCRDRTSERRRLVVE